MKLKNKRTGEIVEWFNNTDGIFPGSLAELNDEWEDYEEPKTFWYIRCSGEVYKDELDASTEHEEKHKEIGNYFETKEEAEKAVEKLKAWKRLKDKGFVFNGINEDDGTIKTGLLKGVSLNDCEEFYCDMELLFGGEE